MRTKIASFAIAAAVGMLSMSFTTNDKSEGKESATITWNGKKVTGEHTGTVQFANFDWKFDESGTLAGASFTVDMTTISNSDMEGEMKAKLEGHLKSADFFNVKEYPTASFVTTSVKSLGKGSYEVTGDMTIKGITSPLTFTAQVDNDGHMKHATANVVVDRSKFDVRYGSGSFFKGLGDNLIYDDFELAIEIYKH